MENYIVEYVLVADNPRHDPEFFRCMADDREHAIEQTLDAEPFAEHFIVYREVSD